MIRKLNRVMKIRENYGTRYLFSLIASFILRKFKLYDAVQLHKEKILHDAKTIFGNQVKYGIFKGMEMSSNVFWGRHDILSKQLGQYEPHILSKLRELSKTYDHFIDIGAADGYYAVGLLHSKLYKSVTCFEISDKGRSVISENAALNNQSENIKIYGEANKDSLEKEIDAVKSCVILCDIEGAEFDLFSKEVLKVLRNCEIIIELHDEFIGGNKDRRKRLINDAQEFFEINVIERSNPIPNDFEELKGWNDDLRQLAFSEGRPCRMDWILLTPRKNQ